MNPPVRPRLALGLSSLIASLPKPVAHSLDGLVKFVRQVREELFGIDVAEGIRRVRSGNRSVNASGEVGVVCAPKSYFLLVVASSFQAAGPIYGPSSVVIQFYYEADETAQTMALL